jgi:hypothetical protein
LALNIKEKEIGKLEIIEKSPSITQIINSKHRSLQLGANAIIFLFNLYNTYNHPG